MALRCTSLVAHPSQLLPLRQLPHSQQDSGWQPLPSCASPATRACTTSNVYWVSMALCRAATRVSLSGRPWSCHFQAVLILCHISAHFVREASSEAEPAPLQRASLSYMSPCSRAVAPGTKLTQWARAQHVKGVPQPHCWACGNYTWLSTGTVNEKDNSFM